MPCLKIRQLNLTRNKKIITGHGSEQVYWGFYEKHRWMHLVEWGRKDKSWIKLHKYMRLRNFCISIVKDFVSTSGNKICKYLFRKSSFDANIIRKLAFYFTMEWGETRDGCKPQLSISIGQLTSMQTTTKQLHTQADCSTLDKMQSKWIPKSIKRVTNNYTAARREWHSTVGHAGRQIFYGRLFSRHHQCTQFR